MKHLESMLQSRLAATKAKGSLRSLKIMDPALIDFTSNDYLGLARSKSIFEEIQSRLQLQSIHYNGSTGSRLLSGNTDAVEETEVELAHLFKSDEALIFNSGYVANLAVLSTLPQRNDTILYDEYAHACMKDGARLSPAKHWSFRHNDLDDLESKLKKATGHIFVAVESIYSMDGDACPLLQLVELTDRYAATLVLDEAHSTGTFGPDGAGIAVAQGLEHRIGIRVHTFGKAMGAHGACVAGSAVLRQSLINYARPFIYTTALPVHSVVSISSSFRYLKAHPILQEDLKKKVALFTQQIGDHEGWTTGVTAIQSVVFPGSEHVKHIAQRLQGKGFDVRPILSPTVPVGKERIRICLHTYNTDDEIMRLATELRLIRNEMPDAIVYL